MKKTMIAMAVVTLVASPAFAASFVNGGFEDGNINGWLAGGGNAAISSRASVNNAALSVADWLPGGAHFNAANSNSAIIDNTSGYVDPNVGALLGTTVQSGRYSYRVENTSSGGFASAISQTVLNYTDPSIFFAWKAVLEAAHGPNDAATMKLNLRDDTTGTDLITRIYNAGGVPDPTRFSSSGGNFYTPDWQIEQLAIDTSLTGHDFTLSVLAADCQPTGHFGYVYLDGFGALAPPPGPIGVPEPASLALVGIALAGLAASRRRKNV